MPPTRYTLAFTRNAADHATRPRRRHRGSPTLRRDVSVLEPRARRRGLGGGGNGDRAADLAHVRPRPRLSRGIALHPPADGEADRHERAHRAVVEGLPRAHGAVDRRVARRRGALLRHLARQPALGGGPRAGSRRRGLPRRHGAEVGAQGARRGGARPDRGELPGGRARGPARPARAARRSSPGTRAGRSATGAACATT